MAKDYKKGDMKGCDYGTPDRVDARPDLNEHLDDHLNSVRTYPTNESDVTERGELPPEGEKGRMGAAKPWKPKGRE